MFKKLIIACAVLTTTSVFAGVEGAPYLGATLGVTNNSYSGSNYRGTTLGVLGGYGAVINQNLYLGGEVFANLLTVTLDNNGSGQSLRSTYGYGASVMPGYMLSNHSFAFVRLGLLRTRFSNLNSSSNGAQVGLGLQTSITQNWDVRGEYDYVSYSSVVHGVSPIADQFNLSLIYKFE